MTTRYISIDTNRFENFLSSKGFDKTVEGSEIVYKRLHHKNKNLCVKVYTSIKTNAFVARACGEDAIRITAVFCGERSFGIGKFPRVYRTGSEQKVFNRTLERMREAYTRCNEWIKQNA